MNFRVGNWYGIDKLKLNIKYHSDMTKPVKCKIFNGYRSSSWGRLNYWKQFSQVFREWANTQMMSGSSLVLLTANIRIAWLPQTEYPSKIKCGRLRIKVKHTDNEIISKYKFWEDFVLNLPQLGPQCAGSLYPFYLPQIEINVPWPGISSGRPVTLDINLSSQCQNQTYSLHEQE